MKNSCWPQLFETFPICTTSKCLTTGRVHRCQVSPDTDLLHCPSCKFMAPAVASPNSLRLDLRALFYVADDSERRRRRQIILWRKKKKKKRERRREGVRERWQKAPASKFRTWRIRHPPTQPPWPRAHWTSHADCQKGAALDAKLAHPLVTWVQVVH